MGIWFKNCMSDSELMNQMPISECYQFYPNSTYMKPHYQVFRLRMVFQTQVPISLVLFVIGIKDLYISKVQVFYNYV